MFNTVKSKLSALTAMLFAAVAMPTLSFAEGSGSSVELPTAEVTALVGDVQTFILAIGGAVLLLVFVMKALRWARRAG